MAGATQSFANTTAPNGTNEDPLKPYYDAAAWKIMVSYAFIFAVIGTINNLVAVIILKRPQMARNSTSFYLIVLSIADSLVLYGKLFSTISVDITPSKSVLLCRIFHWLERVGAHLSAWLIVAVSVERFIALKYPTFTRKWLTPLSSVTVSVIFAVIFCTFDLHIWWTYTLDEYGCYYDYEAYPQLSTLSWLDIMFYSLLPSIVLLVFNGTIIHHIRKRPLRDEDQEMDKLVAEAKDDNEKHLALQAKKLAKTRRQLTVLLLSISFGFMICTLPSCMCFALESLGLCPINALEDLLVNDAVGGGLIYINHSCNLIIYLLTWERFRKEFKILCCCHKRKQRNNNETDIDDLPYSTNRRLDDQTVNYSRL